MDSEPLPRKLAAILYADVAGYSRLTGEDEDTTHRRLAEYLDQIAVTIPRHGGSIMHYAGDAVLAMFEAVVDAVSCAAHIQYDLETRNEDLPDERKVKFRIGVNMGDVIEDRHDIYGDGVNVAARLESLAEPGGICISESVYTAIGSRLPFDYEFLGEKEVKNIAKPVKAYHAWLKPGAVLPEPRGALRKGKKVHRPIVAAAVVLLVILGGVLTWFSHWESREEPVSIEHIAFPLPDKPSIAVLPFTNMSDDPKQEYFVDGMTEDLITDLSKNPGLFVIARNSTFVYKGQSHDVRQVARELGVKYVLEGSVRRMGKQIRINAQLIDATTGGHVWAERYDGVLESVFELQDDITLRIRTALEVKLAGAEQVSTGERYTRQLDAYDSVLKGLAVAGHRSKDANLDARAYFEEAIEFDPKFARAYSTLANTYRIEYRNGWSATPERSLATAYKLVRKAIELDSLSPQAHFVMALVYREGKEDQKAIVAAERAIELDSNYADAYVALASILCYGGRASEGLELMRRAFRLNPHYPSNYPFHVGQCYFVLARYDEAVDNFEQGVEQTPDSQRLHVWLAASLILAERPDDAEWETDVILTLAPDFSLAGLHVSVPFKDPAHLERLLGALRSAGLPE